MCILRSTYRNKTNTHGKFDVEKETKKKIKEEYEKKGDLWNIQIANIYTNTYDYIFMSPNYK